MAKKGSFCPAENLIDVVAYFEKSNKQKYHQFIFLEKKLHKN
jgi:hypothetical protein